MSNLPTLTEDDLRITFDGAYFQRGKKYYHAGFISEPVITKGSLRAQCAGSYRASYRVEVRLRKKGVERTSCSCPIGGGCKHVIALLLTWVHEPARFVRQEPVADRLARLKKKELIALVKQMLQWAPELETLLAIPLPGSKTRAEQPVSAAAIERQVAHALSYHSDDWHAVGPVVDSLEQIVELADRYTLAQEWVNAQIVYSTLIERVLASDEYQYDHDGDIINLVGDAAVGLAECVPQLGRQEAAKTAALRTLLRVIITDTELGGYGFSDGLAEVLFAHLDEADAQWFRGQLLTQIVAADRREFGKWALDSWGELLLALDEATDNTARFRKEAPGLGLFATLFGHLLAETNIEEAVKVAQNHLRDSDYEFLEAARKLERAGYPARAVEMVLPFVATITDHRLLQWLQDHCAADPDLRFRLQVQQWQHRPSLELYQELQAQVGPGPEWEKLRAELRDGLADRDLSLRVRIHLYEAAVPAAWQLLRSGKGYLSDELRTQVVDAALPYFPEDAIDYYLEQSERLIQQRGRNNYRAATVHLQKVKAYYLSQEQEADWEATLSAIQEAHRRLYALKEELLRADLLAEED